LIDGTEDKVPNRDFLQLEDHFEKKN